MASEQPGGRPPKRGQYEPLLWAAGAAAMRWTHVAAAAPLAYISAAASDHRAEMEGVSLFYREPAPKASRPLPRAQMAELCWRWQGVEIRVLVW